MKGAESFRMAFGALTLMTAAANAFGDSGDLLALNINVSKRHDDNLFRRPADGSLGAVTGDGTTTTQLDLSLNKQYSLQRLTLRLGLTDSRYDTFNALNSLSENYSVGWQWTLTPKFTGNLSASRSQSQSDFADFRGNGQNLRTTELRRLDGRWQMTGGWSLGAGVSRSKSINSQTFQQDSSSDQSILDANAAYRFTSGSSITLLTSSSRGEQPRIADPATLSDNRFRERRHDIKLDWPLTSETTLTGGVSQVRRTNDTFSARDFTGLNYNASLNWIATAKTRFTATHSRSAESWEEANSNFSIRNTTGLAANWTLTPKISMRANVNWTDRSFGGDVPGQPSNDRIDKTVVSSLGIDWAPHTKVRFGASISGDRRTSTLVSTDYRSRAATITGSIEF